MVTCLLIGSAAVVALIIGAIAGNSVSGHYPGNGFAQRLVTILAAIVTFIVLILVMLTYNVTELNINGVNTTPVVITVVATRQVVITATPQPTQSATVQSTVTFTETVTPSATMQMTATVQVTPTGTVTIVPTITAVIPRCSDLNPADEIGGRWTPGDETHNQWILIEGTHRIQGPSTNSGWIVHTPGYPGNPGLPAGIDETTNVATAYYEPCQP